MKILNETCYNTDDLLALYERCKKAIEESRESWKTIHGWKLYIKEEPKSIRVGYYKPSMERCPWSKARNLVNKTGYGDDIRFGIVRPSALGVSPLVALAQTAGGANLRLPQEVIDILVSKFCNLIFNGRLFNDERFALFWDWTKNFEVRYRARAKRGSRALVKRARDLAKVSKLQSKIDNAAYTINILENQIAYARRNRNRQQVTLDKLKRDLGI